MENVSATAADTLLAQITAPVVEAPPADSGASAPPPQSQEPAPAPAPQVVAPAFTADDVNRFLQKEVGPDFNVDRVKQLASTPPKQFHPIAEKVNALILEGKTSEIQNFLQIQTLDIGSLEPYAAIQKELSLKYPTLSASEIEAYLKREGLDPADEASSGLIKIRGEQAKEYLAQQKVNTDFTPQPAQQPAAISADQQAQDLVLQQRWPELANKIAGTVSDHTLSVELEAGLSYNYKHTFSPETLAEATKQASQLAIGNRWGFTPENAGEMKQLVQHLCVSMEYEKIIQGIVKDAYNSARADAIKSVAGAPVGAPKLNTMTDAPKAAPAMHYIK